MSARSEASEASYRNRGDADRFVYLIFSVLGSDRDFSTKEHCAAMQSLEELLRALSSGSHASMGAQKMLMLTATALHRRLVRMREAIAAQVHAHTTASSSNAAKLEQMREDVKNVEHTATLLFVAMSSADVLARGGVAVDVESARRELDSVLERSLWTELCRPAKKRRIEIDEDNRNEQLRIETEELCDQCYLTRTESSTWSFALAQPGNLARAAVQVCGGMVSNAVRSDMRLIGNLATVFARSALAQMEAEMLRSDVEFGNLQVRQIEDLDDERRQSTLESVIKVGESEAGQSVLRDMLISFLVPRRVISTRRTLLLGRETADLTTKEFPWVASVAHEAAMQGCSYLYKNSRSDLKKTAALLSGLAMLTTSGTDDAPRKAHAFGGRVQLPFLSSPPPASRRTWRLALVPTTRSWVVYSLSSKGVPEVVVSRSGLRGLETCTLLLHSVM